MKPLQNIIGGHRTLAFLDFEGTQFSHEMIAVGCVKVTLRRDMTVKKYFDGYKSLVIARNRVGRIITDLTGITDAMMRAGKPFRVVLEELKKYMGRDFTRCLFVTFGSHDLRILNSSLQHNIDASKELGRMIEKHHLDLDEFISQYVRDEQGNTYSLVNMLKIFGVDFEGTPHDPLYDAKNLAYLFDAIVRRSDVVAEEYMKVLSHGRHLPPPIQEILKKLGGGESVSPEDFRAAVRHAIE